MEEGKKRCLGWENWALELTQLQNRDHCETKKKNGFKPSNLLKHLL